MRVTNTMISDAVLNGLLGSTERLLPLLEAMSTQKRINKPSDDPAGMSSVLGYRTDLASIEQSQRNIGQGKSWLAQTESVLTEVFDLLVTAQEVAISQANATADETTRAISAEEIDGIREQIISLANTKSGDSYIFSGYKTSTTPFSVDGTYNGDTGEISIATGETSTVKINLTGEDVFLTTDIFSVLDDLKTALENNDPDGIRDQLDGLNSSIDHINTKIAVVGTRVNQMETTENILVNLQFTIQEVLSRTEDLDIIQAASDLAGQQAIYQACLITSQDIMNMNLANVL